MKVKDLIAKLKELPQDMDVVFEHPEFGEYGEIDGACITDTSQHCDGNDCKKCEKCEYFYIKEDLAVELHW